MRRTVLLIALAALSAGALPAQVRLPLVGGRQPPPPPLALIDLMRAEFAAQAGGTTIYFAGDGAMLTPPARALLVAQAAWIRRHPAVVVRIEGYGDAGDTRAHALAVGARRAEEVRNYLLLLGVPPAQVSAMSWGKERSGPPRAVTVLVR